MIFGDTRLPTRFWEKLDVDKSGCWRWTAYRNAKGYGVFGLADRRTALAHRVAFEAANGAIADGLECDHLCKVRHCCNPAHLEAVPHRVNVLRGDAKKTHCKRGHALIGENLAPTKTGTRCRECMNAESRERKRASYVPRARKRRTHCKYGHPFVFDGKRNVCIECGCRNSRDYARRKRAA